MFFEYENFMSVDCMMVYGYVKNNNVCSVYSTIGEMHKDIIIMLCISFTKPGVYT